MPPAEGGPLRTLASVAAADLTMIETLPFRRSPPHDWPPGEQQVLAHCVAAGLSVRVTAAAMLATERVIRQHMKAIGALPKAAPKPKRQPKAAPAEPLPKRLPVNEADLYRGRRYDDARVRPTLIARHDGPAPARAATASSAARAVGG